MNEERAVTVLTCRGDISDPSFPRKLQKLVCKLHRLVNRGKRKDEFQVTKIEPWNSVRVTFNIPREAAERLQRLAESGDRSLREMGILSVQVDGDQIITLTLANSVSSVDLNLNQAIELGVNPTNATSAPPLRCNTDHLSPSTSLSPSSPCRNSLIHLHRVSSGSSPPLGSPRDAYKTYPHPSSTVAVTASSSRSVSSSVSSSASPARGLTTPPTPPDSVSLEPRPGSASLEESLGPLKSQLLTNSSLSASSSISVNLIDGKSTISSANVQQPNNKDRNVPTRHVTVDVSEPVSASLKQNEPFRSPNVLVTDPLHFVPSLGVTTASSTLSPSVTCAMVMSAILPCGKRRTSSQSSPEHLVPAAPPPTPPFPFASMQHAMHTKQGNSNHPRPLRVTSPDTPREVDSRGRLEDSTISVPSNRVTALPCSLVASTSSRISEVSAAKSASSNVALSSPLLVNLLQTESSQESKSSLMPAKINWNDTSKRTIYSSSPTPPSSSRVPKPDLKPGVNDLRIAKLAPAVNFLPSEPSNFPDATRCDSNVGPPVFNNLQTLKTRRSESLHPLTTPNDMIHVRRELDGRNGSVDHANAVDQDLNNHDYGPEHREVDNGRVTEGDDVPNDTRNQVSRTVNQSDPPSDQHINHAEPTNSHANNRTNSLEQPAVNGNHDGDESEDEEELIGDEQVLDEEYLDELSDLPPLEPADMEMDDGDDGSSCSEVCNTITTPTFTCVFADQEAVSLGSLDGRQVHSVASGDHNYISVKIENQLLDSNCRSNSAHDHSVFDTDPLAPSDLETRPNTGKSPQPDLMLAMNESTSSEAISNDIRLLSVQSSPFRCGTGSVVSSTECLVNNCHAKRGSEESLVIDQPASQPIKNKHNNRDKVYNSSSSGHRKLIPDNPDPSQVQLPSGQERRVSASKMKVTSESLSDDLFLVNSVPVQPQSSSVVPDSSFFPSDTVNHTTSTAVSILKKKKTKGESGGGQQPPNAASGIKRRRMVKEGGNTNNNNNNHTRT